MAPDPASPAGGNRLALDRLRTLWPVLIMSSARHTRAAGRRCAMTRPVRRVAFYGYLGSGNIGNDATLESVVGWLNSNHPQVEVSCISIAPAGVSARYGIPSMPMTWHAPDESDRGVARTFRRLLGRFLDIGRSYALAGLVDAVIVPGMGVLEESLRVRPWGLPFGLFLMAAACWLRGRPFVLLDVGAERAANPITRRLYVASVRLAAHVSYRDHLSSRDGPCWSSRAPEASGAGILVSRVPSQN